MSVIRLVAMSLAGAMIIDGAAAIVIEHNVQMSMAMSLLGIAIASFYHCLCKPH